MRCHPERKFIYFNSDCKCSGALGVIVEAHMCVHVCEYMGRGMSSLDAPIKDNWCVVKITEFGHKYYLM